MENLKPKIIEIMNDRFQCEKYNLNYSNVEYQEVENILLKQEIKNESTNK